jgi:putative hydrolase of the HAD superfamily
MICNLVFDMGEVLLRYEPYLSRLRYTGGDKAAARRLMDAVFLHPDWSRADEGTLSLEDQISNAMARLNPEEAAMVPGLLRDWYLDGLWPYPGAEECVEQLHREGWNLYILSNAGLWFPDFQYKILALEHFRGVMYSAAEKMIKPDTAIYLRLCKKFDLLPQECLFIDDRADNVAGAEAAGMKGYHFDGDHKKLKRFIDTLKKNP